jgi:hydrogenase maturation protease
MNEEGNKTLVIGIGNSGRQDDGLGWAFLDKIGPLLDNDFDLEYRYQLQIEDAELISHYNRVYFVDASKEQCPDGVLFEECEPKDSRGFSSHALHPETILYLSKNVYNKAPQSYILGISGVEFGLEIGLSPLAEDNLKKATDWFLKRILVSSY